MSDAQAALHEVRQQKFQFQESAILSKWARVGGRCTKEFFEHHTGIRRPVTINHMQAGDRLLASQAELEEHILSYYEQLYTQDNEVEFNQEARADCFQFIKLTVTEEHNEELLRPLAIEEVTEAMKQLPAGKAPGVDSIPSEFYQELWEDIESDVFNFVSESINQCFLEDELNMSKIALLPKSEDRLRIQNYRPISLLNTLYKIVAKVYANRMKPLLHNWILPSQTGFVPNRCILDNIFLAFETIAWTRESGQDLSMLLLDFEKAYDRVNWTFLREVMMRMGFHTKWITQVMSLNENAAASIIVNGEVSKTFRLQRSVRQGCPLAPYLFLLTVDVLGQMLQHPGCGVQGLRLPDNTYITNQMFADDTMLLLDGTKENLDRALNVINHFGAASGAKLNLHKSVGLWLSSRTREWQWGEEAGLKWLKKGEVTRYLGYPFGIDISQKDKDAKMMQQIRKHLVRWSTNKLSLAGRIMVSNQVVLSSIWYLASCTDFSGKSLKLARAAVRNYMWSGKLDSKARARVKWSTAVLPIVRGGVKILDPEWQASALLVKLLIRGMAVGYEPWKALVRHRVAQTKQSRRGRWPAHANWIMNSAHLVQQGSTMWQGVMKAWSTLQGGLEQQDPHSWAEITRQPIFGNRLLTNEKGIQWGTEFRSNMKWWFENNVQTLQDIAKPDGRGWKTFTELRRLRRTSVSPALYTRVVHSIPWASNPLQPHSKGQWIAAKETDGSIQHVFHIQNTMPLEVKIYNKQGTKQLIFAEQRQIIPTRLMQEVRVLRCGGEKRAVIDYNPQEDPEPEQSLWLWGNDWLSNLEWDPREWQWRRLGILPDTSVMNYTTKRGYRIALKQNTQQMTLDLELEREGHNSQTRAKFFNRIWHPYLPRKVSAMQWLVLTEGLPIGAWREKIGLPSNCELCPTAVKETLQHALQDCPQMSHVWTLFRNTRRMAGLEPAYLSWREISRGLMRDPPGPQIEEELRWDTAAKFTLNADTPWDILRAQLLWSIWCQRVAHKFKDEIFHIGVVLWHAWRNTIYCAMEAYKEFFRHKRNEEKRQEAISCFQQIWTAKSIFGRLQNNNIKWNVTPPTEFLPKELAAWTIPPIRIHRLSPSPDPEAEFVARPDFTNLVDEFLRSVETAEPPPPAAPVHESHQEDTPTPHPEQEEHISHENPTNSQHQTYTEPELATDRDGEVQVSPTQGQCSTTPTPEEVTIHPDPFHSHSTPGSGEDGSRIQTAVVVMQDIGRNAGTDRANLAKGSCSAQPKEITQPSSSDTSHYSRKRTYTTPAPLKEKLAIHKEGEKAAASHGVNGRPHRSRPKKKCSKQLQHPLHRKRDTPVTPQPRDDSPHKTTVAAHVNRGETATKAGFSTLLKSRPKRKCRFGPRARRLHKDRHLNGRPQAPTPSLSPTTAQEAYYTLQSAAGTRPLPDGVTPQPTWRHTKNPFYQTNFTLESETFPLRRSARRLGVSGTEPEDSLTAEIDDILREIETRRRDSLDPSGQGKESTNFDTPEERTANTSRTDQAQHQEDSPLCAEPSGIPHLEGRPFNPTGEVLAPTQRKEHPTCRPKAKCTFGPKTDRGREKSHTFSYSRHAPPPSPPPSHPHSPAVRPERTSIPRTADRSPQANQDRLDQERGWKPQENPENIILPDRPTFFNFSAAKCSPSRRFVGRTEEIPEPHNPYPVYKRLGLSEEAFEALLTAEIDEVLVASAAARHGSKEPPGEHASPAETLVPLTKADGLAYFRKHGYPSRDSPGSLWGMYYWAADLGNAKFNFEFDFDKDDLSILDAYE